MIPRQMTDAVDGDGSEWEKHEDEASGSAYYYNSRTGASSWEAPEGFKSASARVSEGISKWRQLVDDESGATYYYDEVSGTSRWETPEDFVPEQEQQEETSEQEEETTPEQEAEEKKEEETAASDVNEAQDDEKEGGNAEKDKSPPAEAQQWVKYVDVSSSKPYYHNSSTGKTQWEEPEDFDESAAGPQVSVEYQAHLNRTRTERLARVTQQVLDPSGNLSKLSAILSKVDSNASSAPDEVDGEEAENGVRTAKAEWQQHIDAQTQRYYYHNVVTGVTQWNKPEASIVSGLADWIPPEVAGSDETRAGQKTVSGVNYVARAKFNRLTGKYEQLGGDEYWQNAGIAPDRAGRQMSHFFDMTELEKNREEAQRRKEQLKRKNIDWKKISAEKKAKKQKQKNEWLYTD